MKEYISVIKNYATFKGRARRREYWMFTLFHIIFLTVAAILDNIIGDTFKNPMTGLTMGYGYIYLLYGLFAFIPGLAVMVRRMHDVGKSGRLLLVVFIIIIVVGVGVASITDKSYDMFKPILLMIPWLAICIWFLVLMCRDSMPGPNKYGLNPKGIGNGDEFDFMNMPEAND